MSKLEVYVAHGELLHGVVTAKFGDEDNMFTVQVLSDAGFDTILQTALTYAL